MKISLSYQSDLFDMDAVASIRPASLNGRSGAFVDNMVLPVHRWFRYSAGFSAEWVKSVIRDVKESGPIKLLDPFVGSGTTLIACEQLGRRCLAMEIEPKYCDVVVQRWETYTKRKAELVRECPREAGNARAESKAAQGSESC